jgi:hypothetical protein
VFSISGKPSNGFMVIPFAATSSDTFPFAVAELLGRMLLNGELIAKSIWSIVPFETCSTTQERSAGWIKIGHNRNATETGILVPAIPNLRFGSAPE